MHNQASGIEGPTAMGVDAHHSPTWCSSDSSLSCSSVAAKRHCCPRAVFPAPPHRVRLAQALLWNLGVIAVPVGVLAATRLAVVAGSVSLIAALSSRGRLLALR